MRTEKSKKAYSTDRYTNSNSNSTFIALNLCQRADSKVQKYNIEIQSTGYRYRNMSQKPMLLANLEHKLSLDHELRCSLSDVIFKWVSCSTTASPCLGVYLTLTSENYSKDVSHSLENSSHASDNKSEYISIGMQAHSQSTLYACYVLLRPIKHPCTVCSN